MTTGTADIKACRRLLKGGSKTFFAASLVLPAQVANAATALYAFCRVADDAVDLEGGRIATVERLRARLEKIYAGQPADTPVDRAFADVVSRFAIPIALPEALLDGLSWDASGKRYETIEELYAYAARVAGTVGAMMSLLMGKRDPDVVARACDLGIAMQLTNIARDVGEDARAGRLYLPLQWMRDAGIDPQAWLDAPQFDPRIAVVVKRLLADADRFYARAAESIAYLPFSCRPGIHAARVIYAEIGREVARNGFDSVSRRAVVPSSRKLQLLAGAVRATAGTSVPLRAFRQDETMFLVSAVATRVQQQPLSPPRRKFVDRAVWTLELFERLERRDQLLRSG